LGELVQSVILFPILHRPLVVSVVLDSILDLAARQPAACQGVFQQVRQLAFVSDNRKASSTPEKVYY